MLNDKIAELEKIVDRLDEQGVTLEEGIALFEDGVKITKECLEYLSKERGKITQIKEQLDGLLETKLDIE